MAGQLKRLVDLPGLDASMKSIAEKIENEIRITPEEGLMLFEKGSLILSAICVSTTSFKRIILAFGRMILFLFNAQLSM